LAGVSCVGRSELTLHADVNEATKEDDKVLPKNHAEMSDIQPALSLTDDHCDRTDHA